MVKVIVNGLLRYVAIFVNAIINENFTALYNWLLLFAQWYTEQVAQVWQRNRATHDPVGGTT